jgi:flagellar biosynthesis GTPase FlhF
VLRQAVHLRVYENKVSINALTLTTAITLYHCGHTHTQTQTYQQIAGAPHETLLVVDASVGRNAVDQARTWKQEVGITGLAVTKLDGTARAGFVVSIARDLNVPVKLIGTCV